MPDDTEPVRAIVPHLSYSEWPTQTVVALDSVQIGSNVTVSGELAVVRAVANATRSELSLLGGATLLGNARANAMALAASSRIQGDAAYNVLTGPGSITGTQVTPLDIPLPVSIPQAPAVTVGPDNITVPGGGVRVLASGNYNVIVVNSSARLQLSGGLYQFRRITGSAQSRVECLAACEVRVLDTAVFQANAAFGPADSASVGLSDVQLIVLGGNTPFDQTPSALQFAPQATVAAYVYVPNGAFRAGGAVAGKIVARDVLFTSGTIDGYDVPIILEPPESQQIRERQPVTFDVLAQGHDVTYQWQRDGLVIEGATSASYTIPSLALADDGASFTVRVSNRAGAATSSAAVLKVLPCEASDASCDGVDQDCSGEADEDYSPSGTECGIGACHRAGATACVSGVVVDGCSPSAPAADDSVCDGIDDDCDGAVDEDYAVRTTSCGVGVCRASGTIACENGALVTHCAASAGAPNDVVCDGWDEDCDGSTDEDYEPHSIGCGVGACAAVGTTACADGIVEEVCAVGTPAPGDATCDGIDDDCDGTADEDYVSLPTACGAGECHSEGLTRCVDGRIQDTCLPAGPGARDDTCDGIDQDCDGLVDEDYVPVTSFCSTGVCRGTGQLVCESGRLMDTCQPGAPIGNDEDCNGIDEDCDGQADDGFVAACQGASVATCNNGAQSATQCGDGDPCNGEESCGSGMCLPGVPLVVDDGVPCTLDACDPFVGEVHSPSPPGSPCGDGLVCSGDGACIGLPTVTRDIQALAVDVQYPTSLRLGVRDGLVTYQFASFTGSGAVRSQRLAGSYGPLRVPPVGVPWFSYTLQPLRIEVGNFSVTAAPSFTSLPRLNTLYVHLVGGLRGSGSLEVIPVGFGG